MAVRVLFADEYEFDQIKVKAKIVWKNPHSDTDCEGYEYALEFVEVSAKDHHKLLKVMNSHLSLDDISDGLRTGRLSISSLFA